MAFLRYHAFAVQPGVLAALGKGQCYRFLPLNLFKGVRDGVGQGVQPLTCQGRDRKDVRPALGLNRQRLTRDGVNQIKLVPDLQLRRVRFDAERGQDIGHVGGLFGGFGVADIADMQNHVGFKNLFQGGAEGGDQLGWQVGNETDSVRGDDLAPRGQDKAAHGGVESGKQHVLGQNIGPGHAIEQGGFAGIGISDKGDQRKRHLAAAGAVQFAGFYHTIQLTFQTDHMVVDGAAVLFDLGFTGAADKAETATLAFKVSPGAH